MSPSREPYIPDGISELIDFLGMMMLDAPKFIDKTGHFPGRSIYTVFYQLYEGLYRMREELGEELYLQLREMAVRMQAHFEADSEKTTGGTRKGRHIIVEMKELLIAHIRKP